LQVGAVEIAGVEDGAAEIAVHQDGGGEIGIVEHAPLERQARQVAPRKDGARPAGLHGAEAFVLGADGVDLRLRHLGIACIASRGGHAEGLSLGTWRESLARIP